MIKILKEFIKKYMLNFIKLDTILAFIISFILYYIFTKNVYNALLFSIIFVVIFLFCLNILKIIL